jgi:hypothetical protein
MAATLKPGCSIRSAASTCIMAVILRPEVAKQAKEIDPAFPIIYISAAQCRALFAP